MLSHHILALVGLPALVAAHFQIVYPSPRGTADDGEATYPCAGFAQTQNRTSISATSFPLALDLEHTHSLISIFLAIGNDVGTSFTHQLQPTVQEQGPGDFCFPSVPLPSNLNITDGTNGTIQVITDAESGGGLYMCADVTFTTNSVQGPASCTNGTGLTATVASAGTLANGTTTSTTSHTSSTSTSSTSATASATTKNVAAAGINVAWSVMGAAMLGAAALL